MLVEPSAPTAATATTTTTTTAGAASPSNNNTTTASWLAWRVFTVVVWGSLVAVAVTAWMHHVATQYWEPQLRDAWWTEDRQADECTYYARTCTADELSTHNPADLYLPPPPLSTPMPTTNGHSIDPDQSYYHHHIQHGFSVVRSTLSPNTMQGLRQYIRQRNAEIGKTYFVLENDFRYSFGLDTTVPIVAQAVMELTNHPQVTELVTQVMGPDPALVELTAITATYGATDQHYHDDIIPHTSALQYGRSFDPLWSLFVQLQNTTARMGATGICPGLHYCSRGDTGSVCETHGYQLVDPSTGYWNAGDALLMNMNSFHRGSAHNDPDGLDRVMLILTLGPQPRHHHAESRQISQGATMSLRHDSWGHTWKDLQQASTYMQFPWNWLRSYGLYNAKPNPAEWGYDYLANLAFRITNDANYYDADYLEEKQEEGKLLPFVPSWLHPHHLTEEELDHDLAWMFYFQATLKRVHQFTSMCAASALVLHVLVYTLLGGSSGNTNNKTTNNNNPKPLRGWQRGLLQASAMAGVVYAGWSAARHHVDGTLWARNIRQHRLYTSVLNDEANFPDIVSQGWSTYPTRSDVLIEYRLGGSHYLGIVKDLIDQGHYGNRQLNRHVQAFVANRGSVEQKHPSAMVWMARDAVAHWIYQTLRHGQDTGEPARFLQQGRGGRWMLQSHAQALEFLSHRLVSRAVYPILHRLMRETMEPLVSEWRFGIYRTTALAYRHAVPTLLQLQERLWTTALETADQASTQYLVTKPSVLVSVPSVLVSAKSPSKSSASLARPVPDLLQATPDGSALDTWDETPSKKTTLTVAQRRFVLPMLPEQEEIALDRRHAVSPSPVSMVARMSNPFQTPIREPSRNAWLVSGSMAQVRQGKFWYMGVITDAYADAYYRMDVQNDFEEYKVGRVQRFVPHSLVGQTIQVRIENDEQQEEWEFEECVVIAAHFDRTHPDTKQYYYRRGTWLYTVKFDDGEVLEKIELSDIRRLVTAEEHHAARQSPPVQERAPAYSK